MPGDIIRVISGRYEGCVGTILEVGQNGDLSVCLNGGFLCGTGRWCCFEPSEVETFPDLKAGWQGPEQK